MLLKTKKKKEKKREDEESKENMRCRQVSERSIPFDFILSHIILMYAPKSFQKTDRRG